MEFRHHGIKLMQHELLGLKLATASWVKRGGCYGQERCYDDWACLGIAQDRDPFLPSVAHSVLGFLLTLHTSHR